jgi:Tol biopolymer transport system component
LTLTSGTRLGVYEIAAQIGEGGMGQVFRATDTKLKRQVAIKVLPPSFAADPDRLARFQREAEVLASLNHPHIAGIYGLEDSAGMVALVMELVEGEDLSQRIARGRFPLHQALAIGKQIAQALEAAHDQGIVHRDLKPANIKLRADGAAKVLDFGLAKAIEPAAAAGVSAVHSPTITSPAMTAQGVILGTAAYMAPEQARGMPVDKRADIWAFGIVLFEMLSGSQAFSGGDVAHVLARVIEGEPDWNALPPTTPPLVVRLLRRCLEKDVRRRLRDIADAKADLEDAVRFELAGAAPTRAVPRWPSAAAWTLAATATFVAAWSLTRQAPEPSSGPLKFTIAIAQGEQLPMEGGLPTPVAISRDGRQIAYVTRRPSGNRIYIRRREDADGRPVAGTEGGSGPFFSPDGQWLGFSSGGFIRKIPIQGGTPQNIATASNVLNATWSDDGWIVFHQWWGGPGTGGLFKVEATGGTASQLTRTVDREVHQVPHALPGGRGVLFAVSQPATASFVELIDLSTGTRKRLLEGNGPHYLAGGRIAFTRAGRVHTAPFDPTRLEVTGPAVPASDDIVVTEVQNRGALAIAESGTIVYVPATSPAGRLVLVDRKGGMRSAGEGFDDFRHPRISPDGSRFVTFVLTESRSTELWVYDLVRRTRSRLDTDGSVSRPIWSSDGKTLIFQSKGDIYSMPSDGSGPAVVLQPRVEGADAVYPLSLSRDGRTLVFSRAAPQTNRDVWVRPEDGTPTPFLATNRDERSAMLSPDGRWMVYGVLEAGREEEVYAQRYPGPGERVAISVGGGREPVWSPSGDEIFYRSTDGQRLIAVSVRTGPTLTTGRPQTLFEGQFALGSFWSNYDVSSKTNEFLMVAVDGPTRPQLTVALNWLRETSH